MLYEVITSENFSNSYKAIFCRQIGEAYENQLKINEAINYYKRAIEFDPNVGVKMKLKQLISNYK